MSSQKRKSLEEFLFSLFFIKCLLRLARTLFKQKSNTNTIVVISLHKLGDTVFTIPAVKTIAQHYQNHKIIVVCFHSGKTIYSNFLKNKNIHFLSIGSHNTWYQKRFPALRLIYQLRLLNPELLFDIMANQYSFILSMFVGAERNIGMNLSHLHFIYDKFCNIRTTPHLMDRYLDAVCLEIPARNNSVEKYFPPDYDKKGVIFINPFAGWKAKEWGLDQFIELTGKLKSKYNICFILEKNSFDNKIFIKNDINFIETGSIQDLINNLSRCSLIIGSDSGPIYIASMLGKPTFTIYGPTNPDFSVPFGKHHKYYRQVIHCSPLVEQYCYLDAGRNCPTWECLKSLKVDDVVVKVQDFILELEIENK